ncbi:MAG: lysylphosphatidylglycerol synthase transmembrane domain-containing protein [Chloroflexota bacterium]
MPSRNVRHQDAPPRLRSGWTALPPLPSIRALIRTAAAIAAVSLALGVLLTWRLGGGVWTASLATALPLMFLLGAGSQGCRFLRWHVLATRRVPALRTLDSLRIYLAGFALELTPGRLGAFLKFSLLRQATGVPEADTVAIVAVESTAEIVSFLLVAVLGAVVGGFAPPRLRAGVVITLLVLVGLVLLSPSRRWLARRRGPTWAAARWPLLRSFADGLLSVGSLRPVLLALGWALAARACEVVLFGTAAHRVGLTLPPAGVAAVWGASGLAGGLSLLPGGVGAAEGAIVATAAGLGGNASLALVAALASRVMTLWVWIPVGLGCALASAPSPALDTEGEAT